MEGFSIWSCQTAFFDWANGPTGRAKSRSGIHQLAPVSQSHATGMVSGTSELATGEALSGL